MIDLLSLKRQLLPMRGLRKKDGPDNSGINAAAKANAELAKQAFNWYSDEYERTRPQRDQSQALANEVAEAQLASAKQQDLISQDYWKYQKDTFRPLEQGIVDAAENYDNPNRRQAEADAAVADVNMQVAAQRAATGRELARAGVSPESGKSLAIMEAGNIGAAKAAAGASSQARRNVELQGYARKMDAANLGRGLASSQATSAQVATQTGNAAVGNSTQANATGMSGAGLMNQGFSTAIQGNQSAGSLYNMAAQNDLQARGQDLEFLSSAMSAAATAAASDVNVKDNTGKIMEPAKALGAIVDTPVHEDWTYSPEKGGPDDGGQPHTGPMAQDVKRTMGEKAAPKGKKIDLVTMNGILLAGIQGLNEKVEQLAAEVKTNRAPVAAQGVM